MTILIVITACAPSTPIYTPTPISTSTITPSHTPTKTSTPSPTPSNTPSPTVTLTTEEEYGKLAPLDVTYAECIGAKDCFSYNYDYGQRYKEVTYQSFYTGNSREVTRYDPASGKDILNTEIQVVLRDETGNLHVLWLPLGSQDFKNNRINIQISATSWSTAEGSTQAAR